MRSIVPAGSFRRRRETIGDLDLLVETDDPAAVIERFTSLPGRRIGGQRGVAQGRRAPGGGPAGGPDGHAPGRGRHVPRPLHREQGAQRPAAGDRPRPRAGASPRRASCGSATTASRRPGPRPSCGPSRPRPRSTRSSAWPRSRPSCARTAARWRRRGPGRCPGSWSSADLRGDCHAHSDWSDGIHTIEQMAEAARARGYGYLVLTDHSHGLAIARGLTPERVAAQRTVIADLNARFAREEAEGAAPAATPAGGFRLLHGCELEIRGDGSLDFDDELLASFDVVVAALHQGRRQPREQLTARVLGAIRSPHVDVIAHPAGRMLGERARDDLDLALGRDLRRGRGDRDAPRDRRLRPPPGPRARARPAGRRGRAACSRSTPTPTAPRSSPGSAGASPRRGAHGWSRRRSRTRGRGTSCWRGSPASRGASGEGRRDPRPRNPFRRAAPPLAAGAPGHPLPPAPRRPSRTAGPRPRAPRGAGPAARLGRRHRAAGPCRDRGPGLGARRPRGRPGCRRPRRRGPGALGGGLRRRPRPGPRRPRDPRCRRAPPGVADLGIPVEALLLPAVTGIASVTAIHLVPVGLLLVPALVAVGALAAASVEIERRILPRPSGPTAADRTALLGAVVVLAALAFHGDRGRHPRRARRAAPGRAGGAPARPAAGGARPARRARRPGGRHPGLSAGGPPGPDRPRAPSPKPSRTRPSSPSPPPRCGRWACRASSARRC